MPLVHRFTVVSVAPPAIRTHCRKCGEDRRFACAERFRANGNGKLVDIWLLYRCLSCESTRNVAVVERTPVHRIGRRLLDAAYDNDPAVARRCARDVALLRRAGVAVDGGDEWSISEAPRSCADRFVLELAEPLLVRLDAVAAAVLGRSRAAVRDRITVVDGGSARPDALRLWGTVTVHHRREELVGPQPVGVPVDAREDHQLLHARPFGQRLELPPHGVRTAGDR